MATGLFGANPDALRGIGDRFHASGDAAEQAGFDLRDQIENVDWFGPDADTYRETWGTTLHADFTGLAEVLRDYRGALDRHADAQEETSAAGGDEGCIQSAWNGTTSFFGGLFGAVWGDVQGIASLIGFDENWNWSWENLAGTWSNMGVLIGYNPADGSWGNWGTAGDAWVGMGKSMLAWDQWSEDPAGAAGTVLWNIGSMFIGVGAVGKVGKLGMADEIAVMGAVADDFGGVARLTDDAADAADAARLTDDAADAARTDDAADAGRVTDEAAGASDEAAERASRWNADDTRSPDVPTSTRTDGLDAHKMAQHDGPYDTGATIDPETGMLHSTSGRDFAPDQVSHHYSSTTGRADPSLRVSTAEGTTPFDPDHRYVLDDGKTVIETNAQGMPDYTRYTMDGRSYKDGGDPTDFSSTPFRSGTQTSAANWPEGTTNGAGVDNRGHASPAQHRGPNEDINTMPQSISSNNSQADVEMAISDHYHGPNGGTPLVVERRVDFDGMHASEYHFTVTENGRPVDLGLNPSFRD